MRAHTHTRAPRSQIYTKTHTIAHTHAHTHTFADTHKKYTIRYVCRDDTARREHTSVCVCVCPLTYYDNIIFLLLLRVCIDVIGSGIYDRRPCASVCVVRVPWCVCNDRRGVFTSVSGAPYVTGDPIARTLIAPTAPDDTRKNTRRPVFVCVHLLLLLCRREDDKINITLFRLLLYIML